MTNRDTTHMQPVYIRPATVADTAALERLAQLDGGRVPAGPVLVAEVGDEVRAALGGDGTVVADPFEPTAELVALLYVRAGEHRSPRPRLRLPRLRPLRPTEVTT